ncbi:hypothetical protein DEO72_LG7g1670 [Vigna unguiculata]|uniref:Uncharacterized protein n=1 Tax=Vigna unguiculata TaxID=3917 RepID=A0A4D6MG11_VIGUN|nr:hypothetical protein DEO72_LG7g1670 [Vigna unguiculata]
MAITDVPPGGTFMPARRFLDGTQNFQKNSVKKRRNSCNYTRQYIFNRSRIKTQKQQKSLPIHTRYNNNLCVYQNICINEFFKTQQLMDHVFYNELRRLLQREAGTHPRHHSLFGLPIKEMFKN